MEFKVLSTRLKNLARDISDNADDLTREVALAVDATVVMATPVDTGRARSNWIPNLEVASSEVNDTYSPANRNGDFAGAEAIDRARAVIGEHKKGQDIHITNNLSYIGKLNEGWSAQAPANFVEQAVEAGLQTIRDVRIVVDRK